MIYLQLNVLKFNTYFYFVETFIVLHYNILFTLSRTDIINRDDVITMYLNINYLSTQACILLFSYSTENLILG